MQKQDSVPEVALVRVKSIKRLKGKRHVYCIATKKNGNFIANGIIVKNCDALRYAICSHKVPTYKPYEQAPMTPSYNNKFDPWQRR